MQPPFILVQIKTIMGKVVTIPVQVAHIVSVMPMAGGASGALLVTTTNPPTIPVENSPEAIVRALCNLGCAMAEPDDTPPNSRNSYRLGGNA